MRTLETEVGTGSMPAADEHGLTADEHGLVEPRLQVRPDLTPLLLGGRGKGNLPELGYEIRAYFAAASGPGPAGKLGPAVGLDFPGQPLIFRERKKKDLQSLGLVQVPPCPVRLQYLPGLAGPCSLCRDNPPCAAVPFFCQACRHLRTTRGLVSGPWNRSPNLWRKCWHLVFLAIRIFLGVAPFFAGGGHPLLLGG
ncbi:hypothetical protein METBIDRAFT_206969 [Metschnikowia bicuspidata var. bicuspidata NRRL YB-4993]|uniref:Uncharacterized protein n=1 Tax=Metschnikowia bicuspidata var. bicuspidata NRRL YB-4993 TaxID=869754 RepID=A0A1A0H6M3_9ASCO|nr:hypothetical protein METBIDRAFT_206969 [Metschnikowia bicuspidata var. bicuspidata NRRL YB-4993]OBA19739.1 hypothetical protein METBIDRAFT_206969 [Metschnikowia bicuspidata var. bicuspidata NRRL YB-4993]